MLEAIIKRDGTEEPFQSKKANKWLLWAGHELIARVDWVGVVKSVMDTAPEVMTSQELQVALVRSLLDRRDWPHNLMAGRLYAVYLRKKIHGDELPGVQELHKKLQDLGLMIELDYTDEEYIEINKFMDHNRDFEMAYFQIRHDETKYSITNRTTDQVFETPQYVAMRMALHICQMEPKETRLQAVQEFYDAYSLGAVSPPSPNYSNLGTSNRGLASCCLFAAGDTAPSLAIANHIAYTMTYKSAGEGLHLGCRSIMDEVRGGSISHNGKMPYIASFGKATKANKQGSRSGAITVHVSIYDPEIEDILRLQNPRTAVKKQNRDIHICAAVNYFFAMKVAKRESIFTFNVKTAPKLYEALYLGDPARFARLYTEYENDPTFKKNYLDAYSVAALLQEQAHEVSTNYEINIDEVNRHTSFKEPILQGNLCLEILAVTAPYYSMKDLYKFEDHGRGEVAQCSLCSIPIVKFPLGKKHDAKYEQAAYIALKTADSIIDLTEYEFEHMEFTAKARRNVAIGMTGMAEYFARRGIRYDTEYGRQIADELAQRHLYFVMKASLRLGREKGNAPWIHKTKWPDGWHPLKTYKRAMDKYVPANLYYDFDSLAQEIVENGGIRNSSLIANMPCESSSKRQAHPNGLYPVRGLDMNKSDGSNTLEWCAPDGDIIGADYQNAFDIDPRDMIKFYGAVQKSTDQTTSADEYMDRIKRPTLSRDKLVELFLLRMEVGQKARYYQNSRISSQDANVDIEAQFQKMLADTDFEPAERGCASGMCDC